MRDPLTRRIRSARRSGGPRITAASSMSRIRWMNESLAEYGISRTKEPSRPWSTTLGVRETVLGPPCDVGVPSNAGHRLLRTLLPR